MALRIGFVTGEYPPMEGGVGAFTKELAAAMAEGGHDIHIITSRQARRERKGRSVWDPREPIDIGYAQLHPWVKRWWWPALSVIADVALRFELDLINVQYQAAAYSMRVPALNLLPWRLRGVAKSVVTFHDLRVPYLFPKAGHLRPYLVRRLALSADGVIVTNREDFETLRESGLQAAGLRQIPIGSNIEARLPSAAEVAATRREMGLSRDQFLLGYFGFLTESKGADTLLRALGKLDERVHLIFIGGRTGSSDPGSSVAFLHRVEALINDLDLKGRVHWSGFLEEDEVSTYLNAADIMVMPYRDGVSLRRGTLMATLAHGRPFITTEPAAAVPELVHGDNVWLTPVDDADALAEAIGEVAQRPDLRSMLGQGALGAAQLFTWDRIAAQTVAFYEEILERD